MGIRRGGDARGIKPQAARCRQTYFALGAMRAALAKAITDARITPNDNQSSSS
jgi:hypothetical protein